MAEANKDSGFLRRGLEVVGLMTVNVELAILMGDPDRYLNRSLETEGDVRYIDSFHPRDDWDGEIDKWTLISRFRFTEGRLANGDPLFLGIERTAPEGKDELRTAGRLWVKGRLVKATSESGRLEGYMIGSGKYRIVS